jgi:hypothetical protein
VAAPRYRSLPLRDYVERLVLQLPPPSQARTQGTLDLAAGNQQRGEMLIRLTAVSGDAEAASLLNAILIASGKTTRAGLVERRPKHGCLGG